MATVDIACESFHNALEAEVSLGSTIPSTRDNLTLKPILSLRSNTLSSRPGGLNVKGVHDMRDGDSVRLWLRREPYEVPVIDSGVDGEVFDCTFANISLSTSVLQV